MLLGSFAKTLRCRAPFTHIGDSFDYDNRIASLEIYGRHEGKYFLSKDDLGRLNVTSLQINTGYDPYDGQQLFEPGVFQSSEGSLQHLEVGL